MDAKFDIAVESEIGRLRGVILHEPGREIANMTPETAERALYSDILNPVVAAEEYAATNGGALSRGQCIDVALDKFDAVFWNMERQRGVAEKIVFLTVLFELRVGTYR